MLHALDQYAQKLVKKLAKIYSIGKNQGFIQDWGQHVQGTDLDSFQRIKQMSTCLGSIINNQ